MQIADRCVASFHYTLTNDAGEVIDSSSERGPLLYLHGAGNIVTGLEKAMTGRSAGDQFKVAVSPEEGYGPRVEALIQQLPRSAFGGVPDLEVGMQFRAESSMGPVNIVIAEIDGDLVTVDGNHPLAGETLHFAVEVTDVRAASEEELEHGHVHGEGGHEH
jgi:FKBP-type peptidyl-prolyl cis-trans isomerase SlyD